MFKRTYLTFMIAKILYYDMGQAFDYITKEKMQNKKTKLVLRSRRPSFETWKRPFSFHWGVEPMLNHFCLISRVPPRDPRIIHWGFRNPPILDRYDTKILACQALILLTKCFEGENYILYIHFYYFWFWNFTY